MALQNRLERLSDEEVTRVAQLGSLEAYDELVRRFRGAVLMVARQFLDSRQVAEDVAQEAFVLAFQGLAQLQDPAKFPGWLYAITRHRARRVGPREVRHQPTEDSVLERLMAGPQDDHAPDPLEAVMEAETQAAIQTLLADLSPEIRTVMHLFYYEQMPTARIATFLSLPLTTVKWRLFAGRKQLSRPISELLEEKPHVRERSDERTATPEQPGVEDSGACRARRADRQLPERSAELREALQCGCGAP